jgi:heme exporter protein B
VSEGNTVLSREKSAGVDQATAQKRISYFSSVWAIVWKDLTTERHTRQLIGVMLVFALTAVVVFNFALFGNLSAAREAATGFLWITILLAGTLGLNRSLISEQENRSMEAILISPVERSAIYLGKVISVTLFTLIMELALVPIFIVLFNKPFWRQVLLPVLLLPLTLPSVLAAAQVTAALTAPVPASWSEIQFAVALVVAFDIFMLTAGFLTYNYVIED